MPPFFRLSVRLSDHLRGIPQLQFCTNALLQSVSINHCAPCHIFYGHTANGINDNFIFFAVQRNPVHQDVAQIIDLFRLYLSLCNQVHDVYGWNRNGVVSVRLHLFFPRFIELDVICYRSCTMDDKIIIEPQGSGGTNQCPRLNPFFFDVRVQIRVTRWG